MSERRMLGVRIGDRSLAELVAAARAAIEDRREPFVFACANPHSLIVAQSDPDFRSALDRASAVVADGVGCSWAGRLTGVPVGPRITGSDFFAAVMSMLDARAGRAYFFGSRDEVLAELVRRTARQFPRVTVGVFAPPFGPWAQRDNDEMIGRINAFEPDALWVGMTAPKQEKWVAAHLQRLRAPVVGSIGAVFDYYAGMTKRAPQWVCDLGMEWLYRLPREPRRLWRRTLVSAPKFLFLVVRERLVR